MLCTIFVTGAPPNLTAEQWDLMEQYVEILAPFKEATEVMSQEKYPTLSYYIPMVTSLKTICNEFESESDWALQLNENLLDALESRFAFIKDNDILKTAMFLDPRFKANFIEGESKKKALKTRIVEKILKLDVQTTTSADQVCESTHEENGKFFVL